VTTWSRALCEKLAVAHLVKKFPAFYGTRISWSYFQQPAIGPYREQDETSPPFHSNSLRSILITYYHLRLCLQVVSSLQVSDYNFYDLCNCHLSRAHLILLNFMKQNPLCYTFHHLVSRLGVTLLLILPVALHPKWGLGRLLCGFLITHTIRHAVELLWTSDQPVEEASTYAGQHNI
jgi:hypothetical protein